MSDSSLEPGGPGTGLVEPNVYNPIFAAAMVPGTPVAVSPTQADTVIAATAVEFQPIFAVVTHVAAGGHRGGVRYAGPLTLPAENWADVLDTGTELTQGVPYYVSPTTGKITKTAPSSGGQYVAPIGYALSPLTLFIQPSIPVAVAG